MRGSGLRPGENHGTSSECPVCLEVFCGVSAFDDHRVGEHGTMSRRCLTADEMSSARLTRCSLGRWSTGAGSVPRAETPAATLSGTSGRRRAKAVA
jgi:hypothetical protein